MSGESNGQSTSKLEGQNSTNDSVPSATAQVATPSPSPAPSTTGGDDRNALLHRARVFLRSPNVIHENPATKRQFLVEKGLKADEIEGLMRELPPQLPSIPPRTYPQLPPSNLPRLLLGLTKILTWLTGSSAVLIFIYYRFLLPRITHSSLARRSLKQHQITLLKRLNASLTELKTSQAETRAVLPAPRVSYEPAEFAEIHDLEKLGINREAPITVPPFTLLRCTIEGLALAEGEEKKRLTKEELFVFLEERYAWLKTEEGLAYENSLWETLSTNPCFSEVKEPGDRLVWIYIPPPSPAPTPLLTSLETLKSSLPPPTRPANSPSPIQRTLDALADFTGYITTQTYQLASGSASTSSKFGYSPYSSGFGTTAQLSPQQEEVRKEIRALKGLVLNRRTFAPTALRPASYTPAASVSASAP